MFAFSHPQTEQMKATTDYRYIGNIPNNYVKFNCDNDGTNCEVWRIIGVFEVDDGNGNYQQRIKLVRGSALPDEMQWDTREAEGYAAGNELGKNEWNGAKLNVFLNGDYFNKENTATTYGLKELAQSQISNAKYYLGGRAWEDNKPHYGTTEEIYAWERGTAVYNKNNAIRSTYLIENVGLMYPSDYGYIYSKGVDDVCYGDLNECYDRSNDTSGSDIVSYPDSGWIYNSNTLNNQMSHTYTWLLNPSVEFSNFLFSVSSGGNLYDDNGASLSYAVRPVVYLKSSIQITGGEGTEQNPYVLG